MREKTVCKRMDLTALWKNNVSGPSKNALQKRQLLRAFLWFWMHLFPVSELLWAHAFEVEAREWFETTYPYSEVQVNFQVTKTSSPVVYRESVLAKSTIKSEDVSTEMTN